MPEPKMKMTYDHGLSFAVDSLCPLCNRTIDLNHTIVPYNGQYVHYNCAVFGKYNKLLDIAGSLVEAIEQGEEIDLDELREDLLDALAPVDGM